MTNTPYLPILHLTRGDVVESIHYGAVAVVDAQNHLAAWYGSPDVVTFLRSSAKPFQALPFIENGGAEAYGLTPREVALLCASHSGTDEHKAVIQGIQIKTGVQESDLLCGTHPPLHAKTAEALLLRGEAPTSNRHNCSGKHTGMVAYARLKGLPYHLDDQPYIDINHPIQLEIRRAFAEMCGLQPQEVHLGVDGCSAPNFAVPLRSAALGFARLCDPSALPAQRAAACRKIVPAMIANPDMVGGPDSFDTDLMRALHGKVVSKGGAEGYQAMGVMPGAIAPGSPALGITFKVSDGDLGSHTHGRGSSRGAARPLVALEILRQLGVLTPEEAATMAGYGPTFEIENFRHIHVGQGYPAFSLERA